MTTDCHHVACEECGTVAPSVDLDAFLARHHRDCDGTVLVVPNLALLYSIAARSPGVTL